LIENRFNGFLTASHSANGAKYDSQGQALSRAKRVAPGQNINDRRALKERNNPR